MAIGENVLIIDDTPNVVDLLQQNLERHGFTITTAERGSDGLAIVRDGFVGVVILDLNLPDYQALDLFAEIRRVSDLLPIIIITAHGTIDMAIDAIRQGAFDFVTKTDSLLERVYVSTKNAFDKLRDQTRLRQLSSELTSRYKFEQIITQAEQMRPVFDLMRHAVESKVTVLIQGESGTGKELIARALHYNGSRAGGPFVPVNCAGIPETLLESELFGYEKGAFTGATARKRGKFELANNGTLFLDEIGEMPVVLQAKLLRALQERTIERLGGTDSVPLDVRFLCATNRDLRAEVKAGRFREDLFYRLAVFPITIPPLRDRSVDIPVLAQHFLERAAREENKPLVGFDPEATRALTDYTYPGNVRELQNIVAHAAVVCQGATVRVGDLPLPLRPETPLAEVRRIRPLSFDGALVEAIPDVDGIPTMDEIEGKVIERAVDLCEGNLVAAAQKLGISRATIYRRIASLNIVRPVRARP